MSDPTKNQVSHEACVWWANHMFGVQLPDPEIIEREYAEAHPTKVTAEDVWEEFNPQGWGRVGREDIKMLCHEIARLRNATLEKPEGDEAWITGLAYRYFQEVSKAGETAEMQLDRMIREAYRSRNR